jgi:2-polyprenyl-6-methoxyphenol hydroxylase-like FAD-dependent oxidoreductase
MPLPFAERAVVIGAGMSGLAAAKAIAPYFVRVTVMDRDALPDRPAPRMGTPQARHAHALLAGGEKALDRLFPGISIDLKKAGAVTTSGRDFIIERPGYNPFPRRDLGFNTLCLSRALIEFVCRRRLDAEANVELWPRTRVTELIPSSDHRAVAAVRYEDHRGKPQTLAASLVVDASGRAAPTLSLLERIGSAKADETEIGIDIGYASAIFQIPDDPGRDWMAAIHSSTPPDKPRGALLLPIEDGRWIVSLGERHADAMPSDIEGFIAFTQTLRGQTVYNAIRKAKPLAEVARYNWQCSVRRHFDRLDSFPRSLVPIGDSVCRFNPIFGQGMSVAATEAVVLGRLLAARAERADPQDGLAGDYLAEIQECLEAPWATAVTDFAYPETRGERPPDLARRLEYGAALFRLAAEDAEVHRIVAEVTHLLRPHSALREPSLANRVQALIGETTGAPTAA